MVEYILNAFRKYEPNSYVTCIMNSGNKWIVSLCPKNMKENDLLDAFFSIDKFGSIKEYSPVMDPSEFKKALNNVIYKK